MRPHIATARRLVSSIALFFACALPFLTVVSVLEAAPPAPGFIRGDSDASGEIDISDGIFILNWLFIGGPQPPCEAAADVDATNQINLTDAVYLLNFLFLGGTQPPEPYPSCGDAFDQGLSCDRPSDECGGGGIDEFQTVFNAYDILNTIAGKGEVTAADVNNWRAEYEGGAATEAELSKPHMTLGDSKGNLYIADKEAHAIRRIAPDGTITTYAGSNRAGDSGDAPVPMREALLDEPNGLWITNDDVIYILDTGIRASHNEFSGRVGNGFDSVDGGAPDDCDGHGTHVAGTAAGT
ncbi:MAG: S8 family serine peptidase, partial [Planctomycetota bacterium]